MSFVGEINPWSGGEATATGAVAAWIESAGDRGLGDLDPTGWSLTSDGGDDQVFTRGDSTLQVTAVDVTGTTEWFVDRATVCP
ncbi:hypothetical protein [Demequina sp. NBRC 110057]|uniref:hypothetical protein n=1 Tax=Demequina sp. NBRC 110057 TaxID=1570346 RepID=UPI0009FE6511|nr:hypothetical protein [Demequina sp. NBRC 110057]